VGCGVRGTDEHEVHARDAAGPVQAVKGAHASAREGGHAGQVDHDPRHPGRTEPVVDDSGHFEIGRFVERPAHTQQQGAGDPQSARLGDAAGNRWPHPIRVMLGPAMVLTILRCYGHSPEELHVRSGNPSWSTAEERTSGWATGLTVAAAAFMVIGGVWHALTGIAALLHDEVYINTPEYAYSFDLTGWGWAYLLLGILVAGAGFAVLKGQMWARIVGILLAGLSMIVNFMFLPHYPLWSLVIIAVDVGVIWALATYRREAL
jgi:hypothetical protein